MTHLLLGKSTKPERLALRLANRHGLITGATGGGKTATLQALAEGFSAVGVPVFAADVKGDLVGLAAAGVDGPALRERATAVGVDDWQPRACPAVLWDIFGEHGHPIRTTIGRMGPLLVSRLLYLNEVQEGVVNIAFRLAADDDLPLNTLSDLRAIVTNVSERAEEIVLRYGLVNRISAGAILRRILVLEAQAGVHFFGSPVLDIGDFLRTSDDGRGVVNILAAEKLMGTPRLYATFLLWLLSELFDKLPEVGDLDRPKLVFFFDEAHLLFSEAPRALLEQVERVTRLIRSKGVGVYYVTQNPRDVPDSVSAQLGNRVAHALRAFTPREAKAIKAAAATFRPNPDLDLARVIQELEVGEALVSLLDDAGRPSMVQRTMIRPPASRMGPLSPEERAALMAASPIAGRYDTADELPSAADALAKGKPQSAAGWLGSVESLLPDSVRKPLAKVADMPPGLMMWGALGIAMARLLHKPRVAK